MNGQAASRALLPVLLLALCASQAGAWDWLQAPVEPPIVAEVPDGADAPAQRPAATPARTASRTLAPAGPDDGHCIRAILAAERRHGIPDHLLLALGLQEAGYTSASGLTVWPWSVNAAGEGRRFRDMSAAMRYVRDKQAAGVDSIDVGCMQINLRWHPDAFASLEQGFDPDHNADYAARFLRELLQDADGDWQLASGRYHSYNPGPQQIYLASLRRNQQVARDRITQFMALAGSAGGDPGADFVPSARGPGDFASRQMSELPPRSNRPSPPRTPASYRSEGAMWDADLAGDEGDARTLYSAEDIQPVLPNFLNSES